MTDEQKITGKKVIDDCVILARDLGLYIAELSRRVYSSIKSALDKNERREKTASHTAE